jgi:hypothetical protein
VVITPEYNPTAYRADYWIPVRPETDAALFLGACKLILDENLQDIDYIKGYTDMPLLVRTDTLQYLDPRDVIADFKFPDFSKSYSGRIQALKPDQIERLGGMMVWDLTPPSAMMRGALSSVGTSNSTRPVPSGFMRPMRLPLLSVNHTVPSAASAIVVGPLAGCGSENSVTLPVAVSRSFAPSQRCCAEAQPATTSVATTNNSPRMRTPETGCVMLPKPRRSEPGLEVTANLRSPRRS